MRSGKTGLRHGLLEIRLSTPASETALASQIIIKELFETVDWSEIRSAHIYDSVAKWREIDTKLLIDKLRQQRPAIKIAMPTSSKSEPLPEHKFDLIIVPVLGFDKQCHRLGLGGGWYDRFLANQPQALKIGLAYQAGYIEDGLPHEPHDIALDLIITEKGIIRP